MARQKVTLQQIADELGTSKVTVSRALNGKGGISDNLRRRIVERANSYGYTLSQRQDTPVQSLAYVIPQRYFLELDRFYTVIYLYLNRLCQAKHIVLSAITISREEETQGKLPATVLYQKFDGAFLVGDCSETIAQALQDMGLPTVMIDFRRAGSSTSCVLSDNFALGYEIGEYLIGLGHRKIGFVGDYYNNVNICDRYMGLKKAHLLNGLCYNSAYDLINNDCQTGLYTLSFDLPAALPTAYVCSCDMAAYYLYEKLRSAQVNVPEDISVVSFDNTEICENMSPKLTSMEIEKEDFAQLAFEQMLKRINAVPVLPRYSFVRSRLIIRDSVRRVNE